MDKSSRYEAKYNDVLLSDEHAAALGQVVAHWSLFENHLLETIPIIVGARGPAVTAITVELNSMMAVQILETLFSFVSSDEIETMWRSITSRFETLRPMRNDAVHSDWMIIDSVQILSRVRARGSYRVEHYPVTIETLHKLVDQIKRLCDDLIELQHYIILNEDIRKLIMSARPTSLRTHGRLAPSGIPTLPKTRPKDSKLSSAQKRDARKAAEKPEGGGEPS